MQIHTTLAFAGHAKRMQNLKKENSKKKKPNSSSSSSHQNILTCVQTTTTKIIFAKEYDYTSEYFFLRTEDGTWSTLREMMKTLRNKLRPARTYRFIYSSSHHTKCCSYAFLIRADQKWNERRGSSNAQWKTAGHFGRAHSDFLLEAINLLEFQL